MSREDDLLALADLVEKAEAGSRELDAEIWLATSPGATRKSTTAKSSKGLWPNYDIDETRDASGQLIIVPEFTASLDAVMSLLSGCAWKSVRIERTGDTFGGFVDAIDTNAATPVLALCTAALRACANGSAG